MSTKENIDKARTKMQETAKKPIRIIVMSLILVGFIVATAPWFHWLWFDGFYMMPGAWLIGLLTIIMFFVYLTRIWNRYDNLLKAWKDLPQLEQKKKRKPQFQIIRLGLSLVGLIFLAILAWKLQYATAQVALAQSTRVETINKLPETTQVRYLPLKVARNCMNTSGDSSYDLGDLDPNQGGNEINWVAPRQPHGYWNTLTKNTQGVAFIDNTCKASEFGKPMQYGEGMRYYDSLIRQLTYRNYWADIPEIFYIRDGDEILGVAPYLRFRMDWLSLTRVPKWGGDFIIHADGTIEDLSPAEAQQDPRLTGQRIYPEKLARKIADAWEYKDGIWNAWFSHIDQTSVPDISDEDNQMPYLVPTSNGPTWSVAFEPHSRSQALYKMMFINALTGKVSMYTPSEKNWVGVNQSAEMIRSSVNVTWLKKGSDGATTGTFVAIEPRPIVHNGNVYWMLSVTNEEASKVTFTALVNAANRQEVRTFCNVDELKQFLQGTNDGFQGAPPCLTGQQPQQQSTPKPEPQPTISATTPPAGTDISTMTDRQLYDELGELAREDKANAELQQQIADELRRRHEAPVPTPSR